MTNDLEIIRKVLREAGLVVGDVYEVLDIRKKSPRLIAALIRLLDEEITESNLKEGVVRALATREARHQAGPILLREFERTPKTQFALRWAIGNTIDAIMTEDLVDEVMRIVKDRSNGRSREMFVLALGRVMSDPAEQALISLLDDDEVVLHAAKALGRRKSKLAVGKLRGLLNHPRVAVRREAKRALQRIEKSDQNMH